MVKVEVRRPFETAFEDVTSKFGIKSSDVDLSVDAQGIGTIRTEPSDRVFNQFIVGSEVRIFIPEAGIIPTTPDHQGFIIDELNPKLLSGDMEEVEIPIAGALDLLTTIPLDIDLVGLNINAAMIHLLSRARKVNGDPIFICESKLPNSIVSKATPGTPILDVIKSLIADSNIVNTEDNFNIRFPHFITKLRADSTKPIIVSFESEPDVYAGFDHHLTDDIILKMVATDIPSHYSEIAYSIGNIVKTRKFKNLRKSVGLKVYSPESNIDASEQIVDGIRSVLKSLTPAIALEMFTNRRMGIGLNQRIFVDSDTFNVHDTFIVLGMKCTMEPNPTWKFLLGFNLQRFESFLKA